MIEASPCSILWFRDDLRLQDHPALAAAAQAGKVVPVFLLDEVYTQLGGAPKWWLHQALQSLSSDIRKGGGSLILETAPAADVLALIAQETGAKAVHSMAARVPAERDHQAMVRQQLAGQGIQLVLHDGALLHDPAKIRTKTGNPYSVFTPFWKTFSQWDSKIINSATHDADIQWMAHRVQSIRLMDLNLLPAAPDWAGGLRDAWEVSEQAAHSELEDFVTHRLGQYSTNRDYPAITGTSRLSPYLRWGQISSGDVWRRVRAAMALDLSLNDAGWAYLRQLGWREFAHHVLWANPYLPTRNLKSEFDAFPWEENAKAFDQWKHGRTGFPLVDAGMRELMHTGWMHNRARMVTASFLVKDLMLDWRDGLAWFDDALIDADPAIDPFSWQWVAGSGADAAPYFRVFNPEMQAKKFDPNSRYIDAWVGVSSKEGCIDAQHRELIMPIVDHALARQRALEAYRSLRNT